ERPREDTVAIPEKPGPQLSDRQAEIYRFLEGNGPRNVLVIAQALGLRTAKDVNPDLYKMKSKHILDFDEKLKVWTIYRPEDSGRRNHQSTAIIYQQNPVNVMHQSGPNSHISIANSHSTQIGHGNIITRQITSGEQGKWPERRSGEGALGGCPLPGGW
ncbi:Z-DNA-binding protein 1 isoform e, partial [Daubentonia madagascariensis]